MDGVFQHCTPVYYICEAAPRRFVQERFGVKRSDTATSGSLSSPDRKHFRDSCVMLCESLV